MYVGAFTSEWKPEEIIRVGNFQCLLEKETINLCEEW